MDGDFETGPVSQTIKNLKIGNTYTLTFDYAFGQQTGFSGPTQQSLGETLGGQSWDSGTVNVANHDFTGWTQVTQTFTATSTTATLSFLAASTPQVPPFAMISNVSLTGVPEPAVWSMMILGMAGLGGLARRRRALGLAAA